MRVRTFGTPAFAPGTLLAVLLLIGALLLTWQEPEAPGPQLDWQGSTRRGDVAAEDVLLLQFRPDGQLDFRATATHAYHDPAQRATFLYGLHLMRPQAQGPLTLQSRSGRVLDASRVVDLYQDVRIDMAPDYRALTQALRYDPAAGLVSTGLPVRLLRGDDWMTGVGLRLSIPERTAELMSQVRAYYAP